MKSLFAICLALFVSLSITYSQNSNPDVKQDIQDLRNDIKDLEAEIADARINYPEDVPELEKELASMKKMLSAFEKMAGMSSTSPSKPEPVTSVTKPVNRSPLVSISRAQTPVVPTQDQAEDHLLWYKGKKINDSTLITTRALVVQFQKSKNRVVAEPHQKNDPFKHVIEELEKSEKRRDELVEQFSQMKNGTLYYPNLIQSLEVYDDLEERYGAAVKNTIDVPEPNIPNVNFKNINDNRFSRGPNIGHSYNHPSDPLKDLNDWINATLKKADELETQLPPVGDFPPPPKKDIGICGVCDPNTIKRERAEDEKWNEEFMGKEAEIMLLRLSVERVRALLGMNGDMMNSLSLMNRMSTKVKILFDKYGNKYEYAKTVLPVVLGFERQKQLLGINDDSSIPMFSQMLSFDYTKLLQEQMEIKNYNFVLNMSQHLGLARQKELLGVGEENGVAIMKEVNMAMNFNRFALTLDLDFIYEQRDEDEKLELKATGSISTKNRVYVSLYEDSCFWRVMLNDVDYNNANEQLAAIPLEVKAGEKTIRNEDDEFITFSYSGKKDMVAFLPEFKIDLCNTYKKDSAFMMPMNFPYGYMPKVGNDLNQNYKDEMLPIANNMFIDLNKMEGNESEGMDLAAGIIETLSQDNLTNPTGNAKLDKMQREYNIKLKQDSYKKDLSKMGLNKKSVFLFNANNGSSVFIDQINDTKHAIDENTKLVKGQIHLRMVHDPVQ